MGNNPVNSPSAAATTGFIQKIATIFPELFKDFSRTKLNFQGPPTRNAISWTVYKFTFPVQGNRYLTLRVFVPSPFLHLSVHLTFLFISSGFSIRNKVRGRNVEVGSEGATSRWSGGMLPLETFKI